MSRILIMAGGTGGHVIPALAVARALIDQGVSISWIGTRHGLEARLVQQADIEFDVIDIKGLRRSGLKRKLTMPLMLLNAMRQSFMIFRKRRPGAVLGMGGFVSGPGGLVAVMLRIPLVLHEQNTVAGMTNRWLSGLSRQVLTGFPAADGIKKFSWIGNPVRKEILDIADPAERMQGREGPLRILVVGGSQGAGVFNDHLARLLKQHVDLLEVRHQSGKDRADSVQQAYAGTGITYQVTEFIDDMAVAYEWSDVVVCRSGAMTVSEVCAAGCVGIFVPYPHAVNDHQTSNARYLVDQGAAMLVDQQEFVKGEWVEMLVDLGRNRQRLVEMGNLARQQSKPDATSRLAEQCLEVLRA